MADIIDTVGSVADPINFVDAIRNSVRSLLERFSGRAAGKVRKKTLMHITLTNTLSGTKDPFVAEFDPVRMYNCGPTVYGVQHIGNLSMFVFTDLLRRMLEANGLKVNQVINITDFGHLTGDNEGDADQGEDRMTRALKTEGKLLTMENMKELAERYTKIWLGNLSDLAIDTSRIQFPRASDYIPAQVALIKTLEEKGYAYRADAGVYYDTSKFRDYGALGGINLAGLQSGARVKADTQKRNPTDFILWKSDPHLGWDSPWGMGFPGWHIECSAMARSCLGEQIDIHTGGIEHIPIHHNNEIAQSEAATGKKPFARTWMHRAHLQIDDHKISKSAGATVYLTDIVEKGFHPLSFRYWLLTSHYRSSSNFTWEALAAAQTAFLRLHRIARDSRLLAKGKSIVPSDYASRVLAHVCDDLDTAGALSVVWEMMKDEKLGPADIYGGLLYADTLFGIGLSKPDDRIMKQLKHTFGEEVKADVLPPEIHKLVTDRDEARTQKDWARSDTIRDELAAAEQRNGTDDSAL
jgi:cysteinyl-tRNA synthetase